MKRFIIYSRKSKEAQSGNTQHTHATSEWQVNNYLKSLDEQGIKYEIVSSHEEDISGGGYYTKRPIFREIVERCKEDKSLWLLCSKADRMARNLRTGTELMETINFILANAPDADDLQKQLEFMIAERENKNTSTRWKDMHKAKKSRCDKTGEEFIWGGNSEKWKETYQRNKKLGLHKKNRNVEASYQKMLPVADELRKMVSYSNDTLTQPDIADRLNSSGFRTARGGMFTKSSVCAMIKKYDISEYRPKNKSKRVTV